MKQAAQIRRKATIEGRFGARSTGSGGGSASSGSSAGATTPVGELINLRSNVGKVAQYAVFVMFRMSNKPGSVDKALGTTCRPYPDTTTFFGEFLNWQIEGLTVSNLLNTHSFEARHR